MALLLVLAAMVGVLAEPAIASPPNKMVRIINFAFLPGRLTIHKGTKVTWKWAGGSTVHNVTVVKGPVKFHSASKSRGIFSHLFRRAGSYHLVCTIHPFMTETIVVK